MNLTKTTDKQYHLYGMGNALLDIEYRANDQLLQDLNISKGHMTLVDNERQKKIQQALKKENEDQQIMACGGSAANSLIAASQWGAKTFYSCKVAGDPEGVFYLDDLKKHGVDSLGRGGGTGETGRCLILVTPDAQRSMNTHLGISAQYSTREITTSALAKSKYLYIEGYLVASPPSHQAILAARKLADEQGIKTALTFSDVSMLTPFRTQMQEVLGQGVDVLFANEEELLAYTQQNDISQALEALKPLAKILAITRGAQGALIWDGQHLHEIPAPTITPVDSNGAGDMFAGIFLAALTYQHMPPRQAGVLGLLLRKSIGPKMGA